MTPLIAAVIVSVALLGFAAFVLWLRVWREDKALTRTEIVQRLVALEERIRVDSRPGAPLGALTPKSFMGNVGGSGRRA